MRGGSEEVRLDASEERNGVLEYVGAGGPGGVGGGLGRSRGGLFSRTRVLRLCVDFGDARGGDSATFRDARSFSRKSLLKLRVDFGVAKGGDATVSGGLYGNCAPIPSRKDSKLSFDVDVAKGGGLGASGMEELCAAVRSGLENFVAPDGSDVEHDNGEDVVWGAGETLVLWEAEAVKWCAGVGGRFSFADLTGGWRADGDDWVGNVGGGSDKYRCTDELWARRVAVILERFMVSCCTVPVDGCATGGASDETYNDGPKVSNGTVVL
jgi:hypothetical protein